MPKQAHKALIASVLKNLGHAVPTDSELDEVLRKAFYEVKTIDGVDPDVVKYKLSMTPVDPEWVKSTFP